jgi:hypothetical protein
MNIRRVTGALALLVGSACTGADNGGQQAVEEQLEKTPVSGPIGQPVTETQEAPDTSHQEVLLAQNGLKTVAQEPQPAASVPDRSKQKQVSEVSYDQARWDPIHFKPAIETATDEQCLACHKEILERNVLDVSPAGVKASESLAWYQTLGVYEGDQQTFHQRHLTGELAERVMNLSCNFCHQGNDLREEAPRSSASNQDASGFVLRKMVDPETTCLRCHGDMNWINMGIPGSWAENGKLFQDNCMTCHLAIRTNRHQVTYLKADAIEEAGKENSDSCYGCHGGRKWYRIQYSYPRHAWPGGGDVVPEWAKDRPTESEERFRLSNK